jgi:pantothenate kinase-related protein Tda10
MEIITRGEGIPFEPDLKTTERLNTLANTESSKLYCPSFTKSKSKNKGDQRNNYQTSVRECAK